MGSVKKYRQYAADCVRQAQSEETPDDKTIMLNVALAWLRLAQQTEEIQQEAVQDEAPPTVPGVEQAELVS